MKYIITEEQEKVIDQSKFDMGPLGEAIRKVIDLYDLPFVEKYVVIYMDNNLYMLILWSSRGAVSSEVERRIAKRVEQFVPVELMVSIIS
jgi:hypothetical protein